MTSLARDLARITGGAHVLTDPDLMAGYLTDWTRRYRGDAACVVRPGTAAQVAEVLRYCAARSVPVVPQGGNTGLVGGSVPPRAGAAAGPLPVLLSARRLTALGPVDPVAGQVTAGAGVTIARLRAHAAAAGLEYGVDLGSRESATVGGTIATNAGGIHVIRYGKTRAQLVGLTAVLPDGSVLGDLAGLAAGTAGYDLTQLLAGSEGTLAVITAARLALWPAASPAAVLLAGAGGIEAAAATAAAIRARVPGLLAAEYFEAAGLDLVRRHAGLPRPLSRDYPAYLLAEIPGPAGDLDWLAEVLPDDVAVAMQARDRAALWAYRERLTESISAAGVPHKVDVAVPPASLGAFRAGLDDAVLAAAGGAAASTVVYGHIGVSNLHVNVLGPDPADTAVDAAVARLVVAHQGSPAAEHGVGRAKTDWLSWSRPPGEVGALRAVKAALDPAGLLNPGVLVPAAQAASGFR
ncbi:MAG TPA: FAD-binding oxidoreductase [Streptosporangiaceae bacterium]|jgi:FAD/FMN-containing dehydrogenase